MRNSLLLVFVLAVVFGLLLVACPGERDNPLDPEVFKNHDPFAVSADTKSAGIAVTWHRVSAAGIKGYRIYRSEADTGQDVVAGNVSADRNTYTDGEVWAGRTYYYRVCAVGSRGEESARSAYDGIQAPGATLGVTPDSVAAPATGGFNRTIRVQNSNGGSRFNWSASTPAGSDSWIALSKVSGAAPDSFQIQVTTENSTSELRQGIVIVSAPGAVGGPDTIMVTQYPSGTQPTLVISPDSVRLPGMGGTSGQIQITMANVINPAYSVASSDTSWLKVSKRSGTTPDFFTVTAQDNFTETSRHGVVIALGNDCNPETLKILQPRMVWEPLGSGIEGVYRMVRALIMYDGNLIAGGSGYFVSHGGDTANYIASWNGIDWSSLGSRPNETVKALTLHNGNLIAGGWFSVIGGTYANYIGLWDGNTWSALGSGLNNGVHALTGYQDDLIAGGEFTSAGGRSVANIAKWYFLSWYGLTAGGVNGQVNALTVHDGNLIVAGQFTMAGGTPASNIASWNGYSWSAVSSGTNGYINALAVYGGNLIAGGYFTSAGGVTANNIAAWNGMDWSALDSGTDLPVYSLAQYDGYLVAGGVFTRAGGMGASSIAFWDGERWSAMGSGMEGASQQVRALTVHEGALVAGGAFLTAGGAAANCIAILEERD